MAARNKIETKRVYKIKNGTKVVKEIVEEVEGPPKKDFEKKDYVDLIFKTIGLIAIALPLYLSYLQRKSEIEKQRSLYELELITSTTAELHMLISKDSLNQDFKNSYNKIFFELKPKMSLLKDSSINDVFEQIKTMEDGLINFLNANVALDSLYSQTIQLSWEKYQKPKQWVTHNLMQTFKAISQSSLALEMQKYYDKLEEYHDYLKTINDSTKVFFELYDEKSHDNLFNSDSLKDKYSSKGSFSRYMLSSYVEMDFLNEKLSLAELSDKPTKNEIEDFVSDLQDLKEDEYEKTKKAIIKNLKRLILRKVDTLDSMLIQKNSFLKTED